MPRYKVTIEEQGHYTGRVVKIVEAPNQQIAEEEAWELHWENEDLMQTDLDSHDSDTHVELLLDEGPKS